jgi:hypothetical protein
LLLKYDFSKSSDPYIYWSTHISALLNSALSDISLIAGSESFNMHKFILAARTPYFQKKLEAQPETTTWKLAPTIPVESFQVALRYVYLGNLPRDIVPAGSRVTEEDVLKGLDKISKQLEIEQLWEAIMASGDRRLARQRYEDEVVRALGQMDGFFREHVIGKKMVVDTSRVDEVKWKHDNSIFADVLLRADEPVPEEEVETESGDADRQPQASRVQSIPIGPAALSEDNGDFSSSKRPRKSVLYPAHRAMLIRSEYFGRMFSGDFVEARKTENLRVITVDCTPEVLELVLRFLYTENTDNITLDHALDLLYAADMLFLDTLKTKAAVAISTLGSGSAQPNASAHQNSNKMDKKNHEGHVDAPDELNEEQLATEAINIYDVIHAAWDLRIQRLEEFGARYLAYRLEDYIDEAEFQELIRESAERLRSREETDTIELLDDIRYYLSERFRLRFEDAGLEEIMDENGEIDANLVAGIAATAAGTTSADGLEGKDGVAERGGSATTLSTEDQVKSGVADADQADFVKTIDGDMVEDEFESDAINYQVLLGKIDVMLDRLKLDA